MSSNQNSNVRRRVSSIRTRLAWQRVRMKMWIHFGQYLGLMILLMIVWVSAREYSKGIQPFGAGTRIITSDTATENVDSFPRFFKMCKGVKYTVTDAAGIVVFTEMLFAPAFIIFLGTSGLFFLHIIVDLLSYNGQLRRITKMFTPLDELVQRVEELSRLELSEEKYHLIEEKITSLEPTDEAVLSFGDKDLQGIEKAMNSLLARIRASNRQQARFVNDASHELRTPIAVIEGYANMLARWGREDEKVLDESITAIQNESAHMKHLVEQLLFLARGDAGRTVVNPVRTDLCDMMQTVYEESLMIDEGHIYKYSCPTDPVYVMADDGLLKQAVRILVDNSAKYTKEKDEIILSVGYVSGSEVYLQVQDTGIGMKESDVEHMFERFYRSDEARSFGGTGLGLSIAKWIIDKHHGHFEITSREDLGTRIRIVLKACAAPAEEPKAEPEPVSGPENETAVIGQTDAGETDVEQIL